MSSYFYILQSVLVIISSRKDKIERATGQAGRRTRREVERWSQRTVLRFQARGKHQTSSAWGLRGMEEGYDAIVARANNFFLTIFKTVPSKQQQQQQQQQNRNKNKTKTKSVWFFIFIFARQINTHICFPVCFVLQYVLEWRRSGEGKYSPQYTGNYLFSLSQTFRFGWMTIELDVERGKETAFE